MLTDLKFLQVGQTFPPATEKRKIRKLYRL
jgi:hypothetical protein